MKDFQAEEIARFQEERRLWQSAFDKVLKFASEGVLSEDILSAKNQFFSRLGRAHEIREDIFEAMSREFLEWYLFTHPSRLLGKPAAVAFHLLELGELLDRDYVELSLCGHWSLFEIERVALPTLVVVDRLEGHRRRVWYDPNHPESQVLQPQAGQLWQMRLFPFRSVKDASFFTHAWMHPSPDDRTLQEICQKRSKLWVAHDEFLLSSVEAIVRTMAIQTQLKASRASNWMYKELEKKYA